MTAEQIKDKYKEIGLETRVLIRDIIKVFIVRDE